MIQNQGTDMQTLRFTLRPLSALGTPLAGDTLFGQLCWTLRHQHGEERLKQWLYDYTAPKGQPFVVVSDAMPTGHVPLPSLPSAVWEGDPSGAPSDRKVLKKKRWLRLSDLHEQLPKWQHLAATDEALNTKTEARAQPHNTINRMTGTTGTGQFAPYTAAQTWLQADSLWDVVVVLDESRVSVADVQAALAYMGAAGFGRDASIGLGKFALEGDPMPWEPAAHTTHAATPPNAYLTLGPCAPQGLGFCSVRSHWQVTTRFGRHGDVAVQSGNPFKRPVLLAKSGSVFWPEQMDSQRRIIGQGLGGVSLAMPETVQQGHCPVVPIHVPPISEKK